MPRYELALILKAMRRPETAAALKRTIESLMDRGAIVRNLESLGERALPYRISSHSQQHSRGGIQEPATPLEVAIKPQYLQTAVGMQAKKQWHWFASILIADLHRQGCALVCLALLPS
uniref:Small ribosomal subunit protein bS6m n=1 Tax=Mus musculus TaxID=10090 RepID=A0A338P7H3_MOUSE